MRLIQKIFFASLFLYCVVQIVGGFLATIGDYFIFGFKNLIVKIFERILCALLYSFKWSVLLAKKSVLELTIETTELFNVIKEYIFPRPQGNGQEIPQGIAAGTKACGSGIYCLAGTTLSNIISLVNSKCLEMIDYVNKGQLPAEKSIHTIESKYEEFNWKDLKINIGGRLLLAVVSLVCLICFMLKYYSLGQLKKQLRNKNLHRHQNLLKSTPRRRIYRRYQPKMTKMVSSKVTRREVPSGNVPRNSKQKP